LHPLPEALRLLRTAVAPQLTEVDRSPPPTCSALRHNGRRIMDMGPSTTSSSAPAAPAAFCQPADRLGPASVLLLEAGGRDCNIWIYIPLGTVSRSAPPGQLALFLGAGTRAQ
jgi:hypothetical protein